MPDISLMPLTGMNTEAEDAELHRGGREPRHFLRDAVNIDITQGGKAKLRPCVKHITAEPIKFLWQSPLHGDTFGVEDGDWVKVDTDAWETEPLAFIGDGDVSHEVVNNLVFVAGPAGIFTYNGSKSERLTIATPPAPFATIGAGSLNSGKYGLAVSWLRNRQESALSELYHADVLDNDGLQVTLPMILDPEVTGTRLYMTRQDGGELLRVGDYKPGVTIVSLPSLPDLGAPAQFKNLSPMPTGKYMKYWRGRLVTATANVVRFSEALAYHLHDERHGFIMMPQRVTFIVPVSGGIWVGQTNHVIFLQGSSLEELSIVRKSSKSPIAGSAILIESDALGGDLGAGGNGSAFWLAENGYVVGTPDGQLIELHKGVIGGVTAEQGTSVVLDRRVLTAVV